MIQPLFCYTDRDIHIHHACDRRPDERDFPMHTHDACELLGVIRGGGRFIVEDSEYTLEPGCILLTRAGEAHKLCVDTDKTYERVMINFNYDVIRQIDQDGRLMSLLNDRPTGKHNFYRSPDFSGVAGIHSMKGMVAPAVSLADQRLNALVNLYALLNAMKDIFSAKMAQETPPEERGIAQRIIEYVGEHLHEDLTLDSLSEQFYLSKSQLGRLFKEATGSPLMEYILVKRLMQAKEYILTGVAPGTASELCGFRHYSNFYRAYKKRFGQSPSDSAGLSTTITEPEKT